MKSFCPDIVKEFFKDNFCCPKVVGDASKPRIQFIDLAKGICILLVVIFHFGYTDELPAIKAFRMPLYFILSGLFYKDYESVLSFVVKKTNRIVIPFIFFFSIPLLIILYLSRGDMALLREEILKPFRFPNLINTPVWFLFCLFWTNLFYRIISALTHRIVIKCVVVIAMGWVGYYLCTHHRIYLPLFMSSAFSAMPFFFIGCMLRKLPILYKSDKDKIYLSVSVLLMIAAIVYCCLRRTPVLEMRTNVYYGDIIEIFVVSLSLVIGFMLLCKAVKWLPVVSYFGRYSIIVLGVHLIYKMYMPLPLRGFNIELSNFENLLLTILLSWLSIPICRRFVPQFTAQADLIKEDKLKLLLKRPIALVRNIR